MGDPLVQAAAAVYGRLSQDATLTNTGGDPSVTIEQVRTGITPPLGEVLRMTVDATGGTYTLTTDLWAPITIPWNANAAAVKAIADAAFPYDYGLATWDDPDRFNSYFMLFTYDQDAFQSSVGLTAGIGGLVKSAPLAPGGVWEQRAPVDVGVYPLVTFAILPGRTDYTMTGPYRHTFDLRVTAFDQSEDVAPAAAILQRVYELLEDTDDVALPMVDYDVLYCRRQGQVKMSPVREGEQYQQIIDAYRLEVRPA